MVISTHSPRCYVTGTNWFVARPLFDHLNILQHRIPEIIRIGNPDNRRSALQLGLPGALNTDFVDAKISH